MFAFLLPFLLPLPSTALNAISCLSTSTSSGFPVVQNSHASPILISKDEWTGVQIAAQTFASDIQSVTGQKPSLTNFTTGGKATNPIIVGTLGHSSLIDAVISHSQLDVSSIKGQWESFFAKEVNNPLPGITKAYVMIGADKRGTIFNLYTHSESFGVSPWVW